jgi:hypothetical protein
MDLLIKTISDAGNIAIVVLTVVNLGFYRLISDVNKLRADEQLAYRHSVEKMTSALEKVTDALSELRITIAGKQ